MSEEIENIDLILEKFLPTKYLEETKRIIYGKFLRNLEIPFKTMSIAEENEFEVAGYSFLQSTECQKATKFVRVGLIQNQIVLPTDAEINEQREALHSRIGILISAAAHAQVNIICLQETWTMPFALCTHERDPWCEFAESGETGPTTRFLSQLAQKYGMVIISPIMEQDVNGNVWNSAVVISETGKVIGISRKNHLPRVSDCNESMYFLDGNTGHKVFKTKFGNIAINICYGRHHPLNWMMYGMNGAQIVFNPCAVDGRFSEPLWHIEARDAAIANGYFVCAINRVGTERFPNEFTSGDGTPAHKNSGHYFGSSYVAGPDGSRTQSLSRIRDGMLFADLDLNLCEQVTEKTGFRCQIKESLIAMTKKKQKP